ncbi:MAG: hypothetical protein U0271_10725 [Polyangiaceae bacterium]
MLTLTRSTKLRVASHFAGLSISMAVAACAPAPAQTSEPAAPHTIVAPRPLPETAARASRAATAEEMAERLVTELCHAGGITFAPPASKKSSAETDLPRLDDCGEIKSSVERAGPEWGGRDLAIITLSTEIAGLEEHKFAYLPSGGEAVFLGAAMSTGVGGFSHSIEAYPASGAEGLRNTELAARVTIETVDSDMGICTERGSTEERIVYCSRDADLHLKCFDIPSGESAYERVYEGDEYCPPPRLANSGYHLDVRWQEGSIDLEARESAPSEYPITDPRAAPYVGELRWADLMQQSPAKVFRR